MKVAILGGTGPQGQGLALRLAQAGVNVTVGSRDADRAMQIVDGLNMKLRGREGKWVLKRAMEPLLPHEILYRPKQGFAMSLDTQFREGADRLRDRLLGPAMLGSGLFAPDAIAQLVDEHEAGRFNHAGVLWLLLVFEGFLAGEAGLDAAVPALSAVA